MDNYLKIINDIVILLDNNKQILYANKDQSIYKNFINDLDKNIVYVNNRWYEIEKYSHDDTSLYIIKDVNKYKTSIQELDYLNRIDPLTKAYNRYQLDYIIDLLKEDNYLRQIGVCILDIDNFKALNDTYGHLFGDYVLTEVVKLINKSINTEDYLIRFGGEEFIIIFLNDDLEKIKQQIDQINTVINTNIFSYDGNSTNVTISFGLSMYNIEEDLHPFLKKIDAALYDSKKNGRNRITIT